MCRTVRKILFFFAAATASAAGVVNYTVAADNGSSG